MEFPRGNGHRESGCDGHGIDSFPLVWGEHVERRVTAILWGSSGSEAREVVCLASCGVSAGVDVHDGCGARGQVRESSPS
jgi:hypothetical protein